MSLAKMLFVFCTRANMWNSFTPSYCIGIFTVFQSHLFSLGMTMLYAAEYNPDEMGLRELTSSLSSLIAHMTTDDYEDRANIEDVIKACEKNLTGRSSEQICQQLASAVKLNSSAEGKGISFEFAIAIGLIVHCHWLVKNRVYALISLMLLR